MGYRKQICSRAFGSVATRLPASGMSSTDPNAEREQLLSPDRCRPGRQCLHDGSIVTQQRTSCGSTRWRSGVPDGLTTAGARIFTGRRGHGEECAGHACKRGADPLAPAGRSPCRARCRHCMTAAGAAQRLAGWITAPSILSDHFTIQPAWSTLRSASWRYASSASHRSFLERGVDPERSLSHRHCSKPEQIIPTGRITASCTGSSLRESRQNDLTLARHRPSLANVPADPAGKEPGLGKTWTSQARPSIVTTISKLSGHVPVLLRLRLSQFCVQGNRVTKLVHGSGGISQPRAE